MTRYRFAVPAVIARLLLLLSVLLMPLGMAAAPAAAKAAGAASMPMQHCPEQNDGHNKGTFTECTMACSAALPAMEIAQGEPVVIALIARTYGLAESLHGLHPDTATPPPKRS